VHPRTGRLFVVTKVPVLGGGVYRAPAQLSPDGVNELTRVGDAPATVTDGAFLPGGRHVVLRSYGSATVLTQPGFEPVRTVPLPEQELGEGVAPVGGGRVWLSSEGAGSAVLEVRLPVPGPAVRAGAAASPRPPDGTAAGPAAAATDANDPATPEDEGDGVGLGRPKGYAVVAALAALVGVLVRASRRRSRRRR